MNKFKSIFTLLLSLCFILSNTYISSALDYYDLKFEKKSENIVKGEFEKIGDEILLTDDTEMTIILNKKYKPIINITLNKDEEDAISYSLGTKWNEEIKINKEEDINLNESNDTYIMVRPVYKEITGILVKDYISWESKKEISIKIPVDMEYTFKNIE